MEDGFRGLYWVEQWRCVPILGVFSWHVACAGGVVWEGMGMMSSLLTKFLLL